MIRILARQAPEEAYPNFQPSKVGESHTRRLSCEVTFCDINLADARVRAQLARNTVYMQYTSDDTFDYL